MAVNKQHNYWQSKDRLAKTGFVENSYEIKEVIFLYYMQKKIEGWTHL